MTTQEGNTTPAETTVEANGVDAGQSSEARLDSVIGSLFEDSTQPEAQPEPKETPVEQSGEPEAQPEAKTEESVEDDLELEDDEAEQGSSRGQKRIQRLVAERNELRSLLADHSNRYTQLSTFIQSNPDVYRAWQNAGTGYPAQAEPQVSNEPPEFNEFDPESMQKYLQWQVENATKPLKEQVDSLKQQLGDYSAEKQSQRIEQTEQQIEKSFASEIPSYETDPLHKHVVTSNFYQCYAEGVNYCQKNGLAMTDEVIDAVVKETVKRSKGLLNGAQAATPKVEIVNKPQKPLGVLPTNQPVSSSKLDPIKSLDDRLENLFTGA